MLLVRLAFALGRIASLVVAASSSSEVAVATTSTEASIAATLTELPTNSAATYPTNYVPSTLSVVASSGSSTTGTSRSNQTSTHLTTSTATVLVGSASSLITTISRNSTATSAVATATNTQACNGYAELCSRKYSNITYVAAHNSPFVVKNNAASNQALEVTTQLNDGIRARK
jgi:hypothetical protein